MDLMVRYVIRMVMGMRGDGLDKYLAYLIEYDEVAYMAAASRPEFLLNISLVTLYISGVHRALMVASINVGIAGFQLPIK